jgi:hypothetical protein
MQVAGSQEFGAEGDPIGDLKNFETKPHSNWKKSTKMNPLIFSLDNIYLGSNLSANSTEMSNKYTDDRKLNKSVGGQVYRLIFFVDLIILRRSKN